MIRFHDLPADDKAAENLVREMKLCGYEGEEAHRIVDAACGIALAVLRGLDAKIDEASSDEADRIVIQQLVLMQLVGSSRKAMEVNAITGLFEMLRRL